MFDKNLLIRSQTWQNTRKYIPQKLVIFLQKNFPSLSDLWRSKFFGDVHVYVSLQTAIWRCRNLCGPYESPIRGSFRSLKFMGTHTCLRIPHKWASWGRKISGAHPFLWFPAKSNLGPKKFLRTIHFYESPQRAVRDRRTVAVTYVYESRQRVFLCRRNLCGPFMFANPRQETLGAAEISGAHKFLRIPAKSNLWPRKFLIPKIK